MTYQKSIQVLRGLAVVAVLGYHFGIPGFRNGFLGVDVFFVISGYLMANVYQGKSITEFYTRRAKRLIPAYISTIGFTLFIAYFRLIPSDFSQLIEQIKSAFYLSPNIYFWSQNSYFQSTDFNPLLNLWSLGVEFHFYLLFPLIFRLNKLSSKIIPLFFMISVIFCLVTVTVSPKSSFYLIPFRLWEFLFGCLMVRFNPRRDHTRTLLLVTKILIISLCVIFVFMPLNGFSQSPLFGHPGVGSLITVIATGLLIAFNKDSLIGWRTLDNTFEWLGKYSYSLYLVHFPILVLLNYKPFSGTNLEISPEQLFILIIPLTFLFAILQYHFVEQFFRTAIGFRKLIIYFLLLGIPILAITSQTQKSRFTLSERNISNAFSDRPTYRCGKTFRLLNPFSNLCQLSNLDRQDKVLLFGNSHADAIKDTFINVAESSDVSVYFWAINDPLSVDAGKIPKIASEISAAHIKNVYFHFSPGGADLAKLNSLIVSLSQLQIQSHILGPIPVWVESVPKMLWENYNFGTRLPIQTYDDFLRAHELEIRYLSTELPLNAEYFDLAQNLCTPTCKIQGLNFKPYYFDGGHLTNTGADQLKDVIRRAILDSR